LSRHVPYGDELLIRSVMARQKMTEKTFTEELIAAVSPHIIDAKIGSRISLLYKMPIDDDGVVRMGVDTDTGEPLRGRGTGFEQDILVYEEKTEGHTTIIPRVIAEVKYGGVTTHDAIVYLYKAECIKRIYPFCRYGMILGGMKSIPGRVLRHGRNFDYISAIAYPFLHNQIEEVGTMLAEELRISRLTWAIIRGNKKLRVLQRVTKTKE